ncbi:MAG: hypothetical protein E7324_08940, partial [Clostridiales bacterium]|nr:hypothetical protein [Clostridiales bacterium]
MKLNRTMMLCLCIVLAVAMATTGTIAYLQDSASDVNVMTMGNVKIEQIEQERDENGDLTDFTQGKPAMPAVGPIGWADEHLVVGDHEVKVFTEDLKNVIDKIVTVKNTGRSDAYIRTIIAIEAPNGDPNDLLHVNHNHVDYVQAPSWTLITLDGVEYVYACYTYKDILAPGEVSAPSLIQLFLDSKATNEDIEAFGEEWEVIVLSQAVQAAGFDDAATALNEAFGEANVQNVTEWMGGAKAESPYVDNQADLDEALKAGGEVILSAGEYTIPGNVETPVEIIGFGPDQTIIKIDGNVQNVVVK